MHFCSYIALVVTVNAAIELQVVDAGGHLFLQDHCDRANHDSRKYRKRVGDRSDGYEFDVMLKVTCPYQDNTAIQMCTVYSLQEKKLAEAPGGAQSQAFTASLSDEELKKALAGSSMGDKKKAKEAQKFVMGCFEFEAPVINKAQGSR